MGKGNLFQKMPGGARQHRPDRCTWQKLGQFAIALRLHVHPPPAKKTLFYGHGSLARTSEWNSWLDLDWGLLNNEPFRQLKAFVGGTSTSSTSQSVPFIRMTFSAHGLRVD